jgi:hypothetical protein
MSSHLLDRKKNENNEILDVLEQGENFQKLAKADKVAPIEFKK